MHQLHTVFYLIALKFFLTTIYVWILNFPEINVYSGLLENITFIVKINYCNVHTGNLLYLVYLEVHKISRSTEFTSTCI